MRKHRWAIIAGVCVLALIVVGAIFIPELFSNDQVHQGQEQIVPGHWWKTELTDQQLGTLSTLWGGDITVTELLEEIWPEVLQDLPQEALIAYDIRSIDWPTEEYEDWRAQLICTLRGIPHEEGMLVYSFYLGSSDGEERTFYYSIDKNFTSDRMYRVSLYTNKLQG